MQDIEPKGTIIMTTSNARKLQSSERRITMTVCAERKNLKAQKLTGLFMLAVVTVSLFIGGDFSAAAVISPLALAAVFSKEKVLDFNIFENKKRLSGNIR